MKWATPAARAPGTSVSPNASMVSASVAFNRRNGTFCARASRAVNNTSAPPTVNASAPVAAPLMKSRRSIGFITSSPCLHDRRHFPAVALVNALFLNVADARQYLFAEQFKRAHQEAQVTGGRDLEHQVDDTRPDLLATAFDLLDDRIRPAEEVRRKRAADIRRP